MRKITFLVGVGAGFVLGSRAGRKPYEQLESRVRTIANRPDVQDAAGQVKSAVKAQAKAVPDKVSNKLPTCLSDSTDEVAGPDDAVVVPVDVVVVPDDVVVLPDDDVVMPDDDVVVAAPTTDSVSDPI
jgi:hypothetical protein